jgi:hypothetical protein
MGPLATKISIGVLIVVLGSGAVIVISHTGEKAGEPSMLITSPPTSMVHTASWYVAHPDALKADSQKCGGDAASIPAAACQNVAAAEEQLAPAQLQSLDSDAPTNPSKTP